MKTVLVVQNNHDPNEKWERTLDLTDVKLTPIGYKISASLGEKFPFFTVEEGIIYPHTPVTGVTTVRLVQKINPHVLAEMQLEKHGWKKIK